MSLQPVLSVVMSVYNGARHLPMTVQSILGQDGTEMEFVVVDDGSTDESGALLDHYAAQDRRMRVIRQPNQGLTRALIRGCREAKGEFIARQDAGDYSAPGRLKSQLALLKRHGDAAFCSCWTRMEAMGGEFMYLVKGTGQAHEPRWVLDPKAPWGTIDGPSTHASVMFRRAAYEQSGGYREPFRVGQDWDLWYRLAAVGTFVMLPEPLYVYRFDESGISATRAAEQAEFARLSLEAMRQRARGQPDDAVLQAARQVSKPACKPPAHATRARMNYFVGSTLLCNRDPRALNYLWTSLKAEPLAPRTWMRALQAVWLRQGGPAADAGPGA